MSVTAETDHADLYRAVHTLSEQVDAVTAAGSPLAANRPVFRKSKQKQLREVIVPQGGPKILGGELPLPPRASRQDPERAGVKPCTLRTRLIKTLDAALADNISHHAPASRHSTPLIFASSLLQKLKRVSGQSKLVPSDHNFDETCMGERSRRCDDATESFNKIRRVTRISSMEGARTLLTRAAGLSSFRFLRSTSALTSRGNSIRDAPAPSRQPSPGRVTRMGTIELGADRIPEDDADAEHIVELLFAGTAGVPHHVNEVSEIVSKASTYKPQFDFAEGKMGGPPQQDVADLTQADKRARMMRSKLLVIVGCQVAVFIIEVVTFMVQHLFWGNGDFLCVVQEGEPNKFSQSNLAVLVFLISAHLLRALYCWIVVAISLGSLPQWAAYSKRTSLVKVATEATMWTTLIVMTALTIEEDLHKCLEQNHKEFLFSVFARLHSAVHLLRMIMAAHACFVLRQDARRLMQVAVSGNKRRFVDEEFDLDLTYIADRLIAMALPCAAGAAYRNDIRQVSHFLTSQHYGGYKIFNLCEAFEEFGNGNYDGRFFHQQVVRITMRDHNICALGALVSFCRQATAFLNLDPSNVVVVHCRGGKGRTGTFCSSLLLWSDFCTTALEALAAFATRRTDLTRSSLGKTVMQGVASPTQVRYVHYIEAIKRLNFDYLAHRPTSITRVVVRGVPRQDQGGALVTFIIETSQGIVYDHAKEQGLIPCYAGEGEEGGSTYVFDVPNIEVVRDASVRFFYFDKNVGFYSVKRRNCELSKGGQVIRYRISDDETVWGKVLCFAQWHTAFHDTLTITFPRAQIDGVYTKSRKQFDLDFELELYVEGAHIVAAETKRDLDMRHDFHMTNSPSQRNLEELVSMPVHPRAQIVVDAPEPLSRSGRTSLELHRQPGESGGDPSNFARADKKWAPPRRELSMEMSDNDQLVKTFLQAGAQELHFTKGDRVRGDKAKGYKVTGDRSLMLIVSGHVAVFPDSRRKWSSAVYFNPGLYRYEMLRGEGEMLGELDFLLGAGADTTTPLVVCTSESVVVLKLPLPKNHPAVEPPLLEDILGAERSMLLYEMLARGLATRSIHLDWIIANAQADLVRRDQVSNNSGIQAALDKRLASLRKEFRIALSQECFMRMSCLIRDGGNLSRSCLWIRGQWCQIYVFSEQVFLTLSGGRTVQFLVKSIHSVEAVGSTVTIFLSESQDDDDDYPEFGEPKRSRAFLHLNGSRIPSGGSEGVQKNEARKRRSSGSRVREVAQGGRGRRMSRGLMGDDLEGLATLGTMGTMGTMSKFRLGSSMKLDVDWKHTKRDLESRCYETTRLEFFDCGSALAARDIIRKQCAFHSRKAEAEKNSASQAEPRADSSVTPPQVRPSALAERRNQPTSTMQYAESMGPDALLSASVEGDSWGSQETAHTSAGSPTSRYQSRPFPTGLANLQSTPQNSDASPMARHVPMRGASPEREAPPLRELSLLGGREGTWEGGSPARGSSEGPENIEDIIGDLPQVDFHKGDVILQEGSCDRALYVVVQGFALAQAADGHVLTRTGPGEVFGEVSMYATGNRGASCSVVAGSINTGVKILQLPQGFTRCPTGTPLQMARLHRFVARTLAVRAQSQVRGDTVFEY